MLTVRLWLRLTVRRGLLRLTVRLLRRGWLTVRVRLLGLLAVGRGLLRLLAVSRGLTRRRRLRPVRGCALRRRGRGPVGILAGLLPTGVVRTLRS